MIIFGKKQYAPYKFPTNLLSLPMGATFKATWMGSTHVFLRIFTGVVSLTDAGVIFQGSNGFLDVKSFKDPSPCDLEVTIIDTTQV